MTGYYGYSNQTVTVYNVFEIIILHLILKKYNVNIKKR